MTRDFFDPTPEEQSILLIDLATLRKAETLIESCEDVMAMPRSRSTISLIALPARTPLLEAPTPLR
jgi:hypothetical protein